MDAYSALFYYYSLPTLSKKCYLNLNPDVAYRNMLLLQNHDKYIHFEFPVFEDHSYNTICNRTGLRAIIEHDPTSKKDRYLIFQTFDKQSKRKFIIGYYRISRPFYYETRKWDNFGYVWGIESDEVHLIKKGALPYEGPKISPGSRRSWSESERYDWNAIISHYLLEIKKHENIKDLYQSETNRLIDIFQDIEKINEWRKYCEKCNEKCQFYQENLRKIKAGKTDQFSFIHQAHTTDLYSRNDLLKLKKNYLRLGP